MAKGIKTGGRKPGSINKRTADTIAAIEASGITPLEYMLQVLNDPASASKDMQWAANAAAPYVHAKLASIDLGNKDDKPFAIVAAVTDTGLI